MPSTFRASRSGRHLDGGPNRTRNGQIDHDVFEGLPVRRWSRQPHTFSQAPKAADDSDFGVQGPGPTNTLPELPMPRDSGLLPPTSKALLRAARAGCIYIRQSSRALDEDEKEITDADDQTTVHLADRTFTSRKWLTLPKHMEPPEVEYLAKRRPGLPSLYGGAVGVDGSSGVTPGPMRRTKFKKVDPETGNISIYEAWVPEGHRIEGEVTGDAHTIAEQSEVPVKPETPAPGTVVEGVGVVNSEGVVVAEAGSAAVMTPPKRRPPPPKRKGKGIGKGRKKKVMFAPGEGADAATVHGVAPGADGDADGTTEEQNGSQMSIDQSGQDDDEDDGEDGDESDEGDESMMDAKTPDTPQPQSGTESTPQPPTDTLAEAKDVDMADVAPETQPAVSEPSSTAGQETPSQLPTAPAVATQADTEAPASVTPAPAEKMGEPTAESTADLNERPGPASTGPNEDALEPAEETVPKEESQAPEPASVPAPESAAKSPGNEEPASESAGITTNEVKAELSTAAIDADLPAPASASPEKPVEEAPPESLKQPETEKSLEGAPVQAQEAEAAVEQPAQPSAEESAQVPENIETKELDVPGTPETSLGRPESKEDVEMGDAPAAPEQQPSQAGDSAAVQSPAKPTPPSPPTASEPQPSATETAGTSAPELDAADPSVSNTADEAAPATDAKQEETPAPMVPGTGDAKAASATEPTQTEEPESEGQKDEPGAGLVPTPVPDAESA